MMAAASLRAYAVGLGAFMLVKVVAPGFYAREDMRTPVRIGIIAMVANMVLNVALVFPLMWWFNLGHVGLALATAIAAWANARDAVPVSAARRHLVAERPIDQVAHADCLRDPRHGVG